MADLVSDGKIRVYYVPTISNINAPTTTELNAGTRLDTTITSDGLDRSWATAEVDTSALSSTFDTKNVGRRTPTLNLTIKRQTGTDTVKTTLAYGGTGYIAIRDNIDAGTAWASAQTLEVFPVAFGEHNKANGPNTIQRYTVPCYVTSDPSLAAAVA
jgi:hypothetical protein